MQRLDLVKFLAESASELLDSSSVSVDQNDSMDEAAELLNLASRVLARAKAMETVNLIQEAA